MELFYNLVVGFVVVIGVALLYVLVKVLILRKRRPDGLDSPLAPQSADPSERGSIIDLAKPQDAVAEADFHMSYGLYDEAIELLLNSIQQDSSSVEAKFKLMEVSFVKGDRKLFQRFGSEFRDDLAQLPEWDKVRIIAEQMCPDDPTFQ